MNGNGSRLVSAGLAAIVALGSTGCSVFRKSEPAVVPTPVAVTSAPSVRAYDVDATSKPAAPAKGPDYVTRTYHVGSGRNIVMKFEPEAFQIFTSTLSSAAYLGKSVDGRFELESALRMDSDRDGVGTVTEAKVLKAAADGKVSASVGTPGEYLAK